MLEGEGEDEGGRVLSAVEISPSFQASGYRSRSITAFESVEFHVLEVSIGDG